MSAERQSLREKWASISFEKKVAMFVAPVFVAVITGILIPMLRSAGSDGQPRTEVSVKPATIAIEGVQSQVPQGEFRASKAGRPLPANPGRDEMGTVFDVRVQARAFTRESLMLRWITYDANGTRMPGAGLSGTATGHAVFRPEAPLGLQIGQLWVRTPSLPGEYFVRIELYSDGVLLDFVNSRRFAVAP